MGTRPGVPAGSRLLSHQRHQERWGHPAAFPKGGPPTATASDPEDWLDPVFPKDVLLELVGGSSRVLESGTNYRYLTPGEGCDQVTGISVTTSGASLARPRSKVASFACRCRARAAR